MDANNIVQPNVQPPIQQQTTGQTAAPQFDPSRAQRSYNNPQWTIKEDWYNQQLQAIHLPVAPSTADVQQMALQLDALVSVARIDQAFMTQSANQYEFLMKEQEQESYMTVQNLQLAQDPNAKLTVDTIKSLVKKHMNTTLWQNTGLTLYQLYMMTNSRKVFMDAVIRIIEDKKDLLITHSGVLKIENSLSGMQSSAPRNVP